MTISIDSIINPSEDDLDAAPECKPRKVNLLAVAVVVVFGIGAAVGLHQAEKYQVQRKLDALLTQADLAEEQGRTRQAADYLKDYLALEPSQLEVLARYALLKERLAKNYQEKRQAYILLDQVVRRFPLNLTIRRKTAQLAVEIRRYHEAQIHLKELLQRTPGDAALIHLRACCEAGVRNPEAAAKSYEEALKLDLTRVDWWMEYVGLLRDQPKLADTTVAAMVGANERALPARLAAARYYLRTGAKDLAEEQVAFSLEKLGAKDTETLKLAAEVATARGKEDEARKHLELGVRLHPNHEPLLWDLARLESRAGRNSRARELIKGSLQQLPTTADKLWELGNLLFDLGETDRIDDVYKRLRSRGAGPAEAVLRARASIRDGRWAEAVAALEQERPRLPSPQMAGSVNLLLAGCYARLGNPDRVLLACKRALEADPSSVTARLLFAEALVALGRTEDAITAYRSLAPQVPSARVELARLLIGANLRLPEKQRNWKEVEQAFQGLPKGAAGPQEGWLLQVEFLAARGELDQARRLTEAQRDLDPKQVAPWLALVRLEERQKKPASVLPLVDEAEKRVGRRVEWELARAHHWASVGGAEAAARLGELEGRAKDYPKADQGKLLQGLARARTHAGDLASGRRLWRLVAKEEPANLEVRFLLFELALQTGELPEAREWAEELRRLEGENGAMACWCAAALQAEAARKGDKAALAEARRLLDKAASARAGWAFVPALEGRLYELEGETAKALERYKIAMHQGEVRLSVVHRALLLLYQQGNYTEAATLLNGLPAEAMSLPGVGHLAAELALRVSPEASRGKQVVELARRAVPANSKDHREYLWLGHLAAAAGQPAEAERAFRRACALAESAPEPWAALILFLARIDARKAEAELETARGKLSREKLSRILGPANEALGKIDQAEKAYLAASSGAASAEALQSLARFYSRQGKLGEAEGCLRRILDGKTKPNRETTSWARRSLAVLLAGTGDYRRFREAETLLARNVAEGQESAEDRSARALVLATRPEHRQAAIRLVEGLPSGSLAADSRWLLAQLYEADGRWPEAESILRALLAQNQKNAVYVAYFARALLRHDKADEAATWVDRLTALEPQAFATAELTARVLCARKAKEKAASLLADYAKQTDAPQEQIAGLLDELGLSAEAEAVYRALVQRTNDPQAALLLARHLGQKGRVAEALKMCEGMWAKAPAEDVGFASLSVVQVGQPTAEQREKVKRWVVDACRKQPDSLPLRILEADCSDMAGDRDGAIARYREILAKSPGHVLAGNNLAFLLAFKAGEQAEALRVIQSALDEGGPNPELLDTRAVVHLQAGNENLALRDLEQTVVHSPSSVKYFHLAQAHLKRNDKAAAVTAYKRAAEMGLKEADLHPLERPGFRQLVAELGVN